MPRMMKRSGVHLLVILTAAFAVRAFADDKLMPPHVAFDIASTALNETRHINVYTPPGYAGAKDVRYPVLYMPDGGLQEDFPHVATDVDTAIRAGEMRPMIVIGIENTERRRDMTDPTEIDSDRKIAVHVGGSAIFRRFIADELMPEIRHRYRTTNNTAIVGESLAGLFVLETFFEQPKLFETYIAFSPSLWWNNQALMHAAGERLKRMQQKKKTLYVASASDDGIEAGIAELQSALRANAPQGLKWSYEARSDLKHSTIYVSASPNVFRKLFPLKPKDN